MATKKLLMLVGDYVEDYEAMVPFQALLMAGMRSMPSAGEKAGDVVAPPSTISKATRPTARSEATTSP